MVVLQRSLLLGLVPVLFGALIAWWGASREAGSFSIRTTTPSEKLAGKEPTVPAPVQLIGTASCSARGCHGALHAPMSALDKDKCLQNEYLRWTHDPHANAYRVLFDDRAKRIMELLHSGTTNKTPAHEDLRCLACHTNPALAAMPEGRRPLQDEKQFGVGCESCHGGAGKWLVPHTSSAWRKLSPQEKWEKYDMVPVTEPARLAQACVGCHVGAAPDPAKGMPLLDVNHDLIAAGHPRLNFEFGSFLANVPPHWRPREKAEGNYWAVGQVVSAAAALDLLTERAKTGPWPEFAEYDCYACHHSLAQPSWRQKPAAVRKEQRRPGSLAWGSWYYPLLGRSDPHLGHTAKLMEQPMPNRLDVRESAQIARRGMSDKAALLRKEKNESVFTWLKKASLEVEPNWDSAEQIYLGLNAVNLSHSDPVLSRLLQELAPIREFSPGFDSPNSWPAAARPAFQPHDFFDKLNAAFKPKS